MLRACCAILLFASGCAASSGRLPRRDLASDAWGPLSDLGGPEGQRRESGADLPAAKDLVGNDLPRADSPRPDQAHAPDLPAPKLDLAVIVSLPVNGDCIEVTCPASAPHPIGCDLTFNGGSAKGCVARAPGSSTVYFQEGNNCTPGQGSVTGALFCSSIPGAGLDATTCPMKPTSKMTLPFYEVDKTKCPS